MISSLCYLFLELLLFECWTSNTGPLFFWSFLSYFPSLFALLLGKFLSLYLLAFVLSFFCISTALFFISKGSFLFTENSFPQLFFYTFLFLFLGCSNVSFQSGDVITRQFSSPHHLGFLQVFFCLLVLTSLFCNRNFPQRSSLDVCLLQSREPAKQTGSLVHGWDFLVSFVIGCSSGLFHWGNPWCHRL